jgi:hypothetical protein
LLELLPWLAGSLGRRDSPGEWMYDPTTSKLHFYPNATTPGKDIVAPILSSEQPGNAAFFVLYSTPFLGFWVQTDGDLPRQARDNCKDGNLRSLNATVPSLSSAIFHVEGANGAKNAFLEPFIHKPIFLPRQARDKRRKSW